jgi:thiamine-phosphate pyrophosphorylase
MTEPRSLAARLSLIVITDARCAGERGVLEVVRAALQGGAPAVQLRAKRESAREMLELARRIRKETRRTGALLFINDRVDVALAAEADGAHVGDDDLPLSVARRITPRGFLLGRSVDTAEQARIAEREGADYVGVGPVNATASKADAGPQVGVEGIAAVRAATSIPVVAIGGIGPENARRTVAAGAHGVAVIRAVMAAPQPEISVRELLYRISEGRR